MKTGSPLRSASHSAFVRVASSNTMKKCRTTLCSCMLSWWSWRRLRAHMTQTNMWSKWILYQSRWPAHVLYPSILKWLKHYSEFTLASVLIYRFSVVNHNTIICCVGWDYMNLLLSKLLLCLTNTVTATVFIYHISLQVRTCVRQIKAVFGWF